MVHLLRNYYFPRFHRDSNYLFPLRGRGGGVIRLDLCMVHDSVLIKHLHNDVVLRL